MLHNKNLDCSNATLVRWNLILKDFYSSVTRGRGFIVVFEWIQGEIISLENLSEKNNMQLFTGFERGCIKLSRRYWILETVHSGPSFSCCFHLPFSSLAASACYWCENLTIDASLYIIVFTIIIIIATFWTLFLSCDINRSGKGLKFFGLYTSKANINS